MFAFENILKIEPNASRDKAHKLAEIWNDVISLIVKEMHNYSKSHIEEIHINLREELIQKQAELLFILSEVVVMERLKNRTVDGINPFAERLECFNLNGMEKLKNTGMNAAEAIWLPTYNQRWKPKTEKAIKRELQPKKRSLRPKPVEKNHFIPKSFIKKYWADGQSVYRNTKNTKKIKQLTPIGNWGYRKNIYSDNLEAIFGLLEGDVVIPIEMLLKVKPLNGAQRKALIYFIVFQKLRNPHLIESVKKSLVQSFTLEKKLDKSSDDQYLTSVYESLYNNSNLYRDMIYPLLYSEWVIVRASNPEFVLPDVCNVFGNYENEKYVLMPLTPTDCLIILPIRVREPRVVPYYIKGSKKLISKISDVLCFNAQSDFLSHKDALLINNIESTDDKIKNIIMSLINEISDR